MKKLLLILICVPLIGLGQTWKYRSGGNDFDGKYRTSFVTGTGDDWPYDSPQLVVNYWENSKNLNLYITKAGYYTYDSGTKVYLSFSNENEIVYVCNDLSYSRDNEQVFMRDFYLRDNYNEKFNKIEIIEKLMNASYVNIRISNDYGKNTMKFSLKGSTKAIKFVIPDIESRLKEAETTKIEEEEENKTGCISGDCEDGIGTYIYAPGYKFVGEWKNGKRNGQGTYTGNGVVIQEGLWENDIFIGE